MALLSSCFAAQESPKSIARKAYQNSLQLVELNSIKYVGIEKMIRICTNNVLISTSVIS